MKVEDVMTRNVKSCRPETRLSQVAALMWDYDFGAMPVVDDENRVMGMITDRDIAIAAATKGQLATEINVGEVISGNVYACALDENVNSALKTMRRERVRRLPVIGSDGKLAGILSINDIVLRAGEAKGKQAPEIPYMVLNASASLAPLASRSRYCSRTSNATSSWNRPTPNVPTL